VNELVQDNERSAEPPCTTAQKGPRLELPTAYG